LANVALSDGVSDCFVIGLTLPFSLIAGGKPAVRNRSDALRETMKRNHS
jgi:hypothetical protein